MASQDIQPQARRGWRLYDPRLAWLLVAPAALLLVCFLILPILVMAVYTFFTFVTAGAETADLTLANWHEFLTDSYYHGFLLKTLRVGMVTALICGVLGYFPAYFIWATGFRHKWLLLLLLIVPFWISFTIRTFSWIHILGEQGLILTCPYTAIYNSDGSVTDGDENTTLWIQDSNSTLA